MNLKNSRINQLDFYNLFNTLNSDEKKENEKTQDVDLNIYKDL